MLKFLQAHPETLFLAAIVTLSAVLPHPANVTPIGALGLFAGAYLDRRVFLLLPVLAALAADLLTVGVYSLLVMAFVYAGHLLSALCGRWLLRSRRQLLGLPVAILAATAGFYLVSNLGNWWVYQPHSLAGVVECYVNGIPYLFRTLIGNVLYSVLFFGGYALLQRALPRAPVIHG